MNESTDDNEAMAVQAVAVNDGTDWFRDLCRAVEEVDEVSLVGVANDLAGALSLIGECQPGAVLIASVPAREGALPVADLIRYRYPDVAVLEFVDPARDVPPGDGVAGLLTIIQRQLRKVHSAEGGEVASSEFSPSYGLLFP